MKKGLLFLILSLIFSISLFAGTKNQANKNLENMLKAYNGEKNANARYLAFSRKADEEGKKEIGSLFRAIAKAEEIHANNHSKVIEKLGGKPTFKLDKIDVKTTKENLQSSINGENYEVEKMYPEFIEQAKKDGSKEAVQSLFGAKTVEATHAKWFQKALENFDKWTNQTKDFFVCPRCGYVVDKITGPVCEICMENTTNFIKVN